MLRDLLKSIARREWFLVIAISVFVILLTTAPYFYGWLVTPVGYHYTGLHSLTPGDIHVYYSYLEQVRQGHGLFSDLYTTEPQPYPMLNLFWLLLGLGAKFFGLSNIIAFQLARIILIPALIFVLYFISAYFFRAKTWRAISFIFLAFASGWGATASPFLENNVYQKGWYNWPLDLWAPESNSLLTLLQSPHLILSTLLISLIFLFFFWALQSRRASYAIFSGLAALFLFSFHPFHLPTIFGVLGVYLGWLFIKNKKIDFTQLGYFFIVSLFSLPIIVYYFWLMSSDDLTRFRTLQNVCLTPSLWVTMISYAPLLILLIFCLITFFRRRAWRPEYVFLTVWFFVQFLLIYSPLPWQRRMLQGWQIPMTLLAVFGLRYFYEWLRRRLSAHHFDFYVRNKYLALILFITIFCPSQIFNLVREFSVFADPQYKEQLYISADRFAGYRWLQANLSADDLILSDIINGNLIPGVAGRRVFVGHGVETLFFESKFGLAYLFFKTNDFDDRKINFLKINQINYVFFSPSEDIVGEFEPEEKNYLHPVFRSGQVVIYQVDLK
ncbi:MAG TPA: hypothetical protein PLR18_00315 [bacterium]|nr:hypothetical protein [bacterium]